MEIESVASTDEFPMIIRDDETKKCECISGKLPGVISLSFPLKCPGHLCLFVFHHTHLYSLHSCSMTSRQGRHFVSFFSLSSYGHAAEQDNIKYENRLPPRCTPFYIGFNWQHGPYAHFGYWILSDLQPNKIVYKVDNLQVPKQAEAKRDGEINSQNYNFNQF